MDTYKKNFIFTKTENLVFRVLSIHSGEELSKRKIAGLLKISPTSVANIIKKFKRYGFVKEKRISKNLSFVELNRENDLAIDLKRVENLKMLYESSLKEYLSEKFPGSLIILFGSYAYGEDTISSDIDIAIIGYKKKEIDLKKFEDFLKRKIRLNFYEDINKIDKSLRANLFNGIVLKGRIVLK